MNPAHEDGNSCSGESKMTTDIPRAFSLIDRYPLGKNLRSRDCGGLEDWRIGGVEEWSSEGSGRHRSFCGGRTVATGRTTVWRLRRPNRLGAEQTCRLAGFEPDVQFETAELQSHICLGGNQEMLWCCCPAWSGSGGSQRRGTTGRGVGGRRHCAGRTSGTSP